MSSGTIYRSKNTEKGYPNTQQPRTKYLDDKEEAQKNGTGEARTHDLRMTLI